MVKEITEQLFITAYVSSTYGFDITRRTARAGQRYVNAMIFLRWLEENDYILMKRKRNT